MFKLTDRWISKIEEPIGNRLVKESYSDFEREWTIRIEIDNLGYSVNGIDLGAILGIKEPRESYSYTKAIELIENSNLNTEDKEYLSIWLKQNLSDRADAIRHPTIHIDSNLIREAQYNWDDFKNDFFQIYEAYLDFKNQLEPWKLVNTTIYLNNSTPLKYVALDVAKALDNESKPDKAAQIRKLAKNFESIALDFKWIVSSAQNELRDNNEYDYEATWSALIDSLERINNLLKKGDNLNELGDEVIKYLEVNQNE